MPDSHKLVTDQLDSFVSQGMSIGRKRGKPEDLPNSGDQLVRRDHADPLSERDHLNMDAFIEAVLQDHKDGVITKDRARQAIAHVMTALAIGNLGEAQTWFEQGRKFIHRAD